MASWPGLGRLYHLAAYDAAGERSQALFLPGVLRFSVFAHFYAIFKWIRQ